MPEPHSSFMASNGLFEIQKPLDLIQRVTAIGGC